MRLGSLPQVLDAQHGTSFSGAVVSGLSSTQGAQIVVRSLPYMSAGASVLAELAGLVNVSDGVTLGGGGWSVPAPFFLGGPPMKLLEGSRGAASKFKS